MKIILIINKELNMKSLKIALGFVIMAVMLLTMQPLKAQVYSEFDPIDVVAVGSYENLTADVELLPARFTMPPTNQQNLDDGYALITFSQGFEFEFNGEVFRSVWVCINGFLTFNERPLIPAKNPNGLFGDGVSYPRNVIAPFWGDHVYRKAEDEKNGYLRTRISYRQEANKIIIQWKNLNINDGNIKSSVGNFQVILHKSTDPNTRQGDIEFAYGPVGGNPNDPGTTVVTKNASVGIKGEQTIGTDMADFLNALYNGELYPYTKNSSRTLKTLTNTWPPSMGTDKRIFLHAIPTYNLEGWGDGDADLSQAPAGKHYGMPQSRFVTANDVRTIMHAISTGIPLDSVRMRQAYHADVNHNGRYFFYLDPVTQKVYRKDIRWRNDFYQDSLKWVEHNGQIVPSGIDSYKRVFYQATEYDAAMIITYMGAKLPELPWLLDTTVWYGKVGINENKANGIKFGTVTQNESGSYRIPVYLNGYSKDAISGKFEIGNEILDATTIENDDNQIFISTHSNRVVFAGSGEFDSSSPIIILEVRADNDLLASKIRYNDENKEDVRLAVSAINENTDGTLILSQNMPNPFTEGTMFNVNIEQEGNYKLEIFDVMGNSVKLFIDFKVGANNLYWNGKDNFGNKLASGVYVYRLTGNNVNITKKLVIE